MLIDRIDRIILRDSKNIEARAIVQSRLQRLKSIRNFKRWIKRLWNT